MDKNQVAIAVLFALFVPAVLACSSGQAQSPEAQPMKSTPSQVPQLSKSGYDVRPLPKERIGEIVKTLTPEQVEVTQHAGTEPRNSSPLVKNHEKGVYVSGFGFPVVPQGHARLRCQISAVHTDEDLDEAVRAFTDVGREFGAIS